MILKILMLYMVISLVILLLLLSMPIPPASDFFISDIWHWEEINLFGKIILIICLIPIDIFLLFVYLTITICTWHPSKKK